ncbi:hypothetical protein [Geopseudomonas aromaticivorans]
MSSMIKQVSKAMAKDAAKDVVIDQATKVISNRSQEPAPARASSHSVEPVAQKTRPVSASGSTVQRQQAQRKAPARKARLPGDDLSPEMRANWMKVLSFYTKEANKHLPQEELPGLIRSDRMSVGPGVVWNHHKTMLDYDARKFTPKVRSAASRALNEQHKMNVCGDRDFLDTLKKGLTYRIIYTGRDGGPIATLNYDRKVCGI